MLDVPVHNLMHVSAVDVLEGKEVFIAHLAKIEYGNDVGMHEARLDLGFVDELVHGRAVLRNLGMHALDDEMADEAFGAVGDGEKYLGHAALADAFDQAIAPHLMGGDLGRAYTS